MKNNSNTSQEGQETRETERANKPLQIDKDGLNDLIQAAKLSRQFMKSMLILARRDWILTGYSKQELMEIAEYHNFDDLVSKWEE